jgi:hypothetical protein
VAQVCPESFDKYYSQFMPGIFSILSNANGPEFIELRGKAMECAGLIGEAVGAHKFRNDAEQMMVFLGQCMVRTTSVPSLIFAHFFPRFSFEFMFISC